MHAARLSMFVQALKQMGGALRDKYEAWRTELKGCLAHAEAVIDFGDDEVYKSALLLYQYPKASFPSPLFLCAQNKRGLANPAIALSRRCKDAKIDQ